MNITSYLDSERFEEAANVIDIFQYKDKLLLPKFVCNAAMDEFFQLDDPLFWWDEMPYKELLNRYLLVPNAEHTQITGILGISLLRLSSYFMDSNNLFHRTYTCCCNNGKTNLCSK